MEYPKWMVYKGKSPANMDDLGVTPISGKPHIRTEGLDIPHRLLQNYFTR